VREFGLERKGLVEEPLGGYVASFLDRIWLRAPYLHHGAVPTRQSRMSPPFSDSLTTGLASNTVDSS